MEKCRIESYGNHWELENEGLKVGLRFENGNIVITRFYNKSAGREYLTGMGKSRLFRLEYEQSVLSSDDCGWALDADTVHDMELYHIIWGKKLEISISRMNPHPVGIKLIFELYNGDAGLRYYLLIRNNDSSSERKISSSDILVLNFPDAPHTIYYVPGQIKWAKTKGSIARAGRNCLCRYDTGDGFAILPENNWATSLKAGEGKGDENQKFLYIDAWLKPDIIRVWSNSAAVQLILFPGEEIEYFSVNICLFAGDEWDGRISVAAHLRKRFKYHDPSRFLSTNDWQWGYISKLRTEGNYRNILIPKAKAAGFDRIHFDDVWNTPADSTNANFTDDMEALSNKIADSGMKPGFWFSTQGQHCFYAWGNGRDLMDPKDYDFKVRQVEEILIKRYHSSWQQLDAGLLWHTPEADAYQHPEDSVYRKTLKLRQFMNYFNHRYPDYIMQVTCEIDNPQGIQNEGLIHLADNGIIGHFLRTENADNVQDTFDSIGLFPTEGLLTSWGEGGQPDAWQDSSLWYYQFLLARHTSIYSFPEIWDDSGIQHLRTFNDWRKNPRIKSVLNELVRPVYSGNNNNGPWSWMFVNEEKTQSILIALDHKNTNINQLNLSLKWLSAEKTYLIEDITMDRGEFVYSFKGKYTGKQLIESGLEVDLNENTCKAKAYWCQELLPQRKQILYADASIYSCEIQGGDTLYLAGVPNASATLVIYSADTNTTGIVKVDLGESGHANLTV